VPLNPPTRGPVAAIPSDRLLLEPSERRAAVFNLIRGARSRLSLSLFRGTDKSFFRELKAAVDRGVAVEVLVTSRAKGGRRKLMKLWQRLERTKASIYPYDDPSVKYHAKYIVADEGPALVTTLNFTRKCFTETCDAVVLTWDPRVIAALRQIMANDRDGLQAPPVLPERLILGPERARRQLTSRLEQATSSVHIVDAKLSDPSILALLDRRRADGLDVRVHDGPRVGALKSHGKMMIIDGTRAIIGSLALTALSLDYRREVAIEVTEPAAVAALEGLFRSAGVSAPPSSSAPAGAAGGASC
jgi:phosphatidylserine/phosphatidylglycerophosphate/cardiolipin synthase-like enzyme